MSRAVDPGSPLYDFDYHRFNAWKRELLSAAAVEPGYHHLYGFDDLATGLRLDILAAD